MVNFSRTYTENEYNSGYLNLTDDLGDSYGTHFPSNRTPLLIIGNSGVAYKASKRGNNQIWGAFKNFIIGENISPGDELKISYHREIQGERSIVEIISNVTIEVEIIEPEEEVLEGHVYALVNPAWEKWVKFGHTLDLDVRRSSYNTGTPHKDYRYIGDKIFSDRIAAEKIILRLAEHFSNEKGHGEWFYFEKIGEAKKLLDALASIAV